MTKKALLFGLNYQMNESGHLRGCHEDVHNVKDLLIHQYHLDADHIDCFTDNVNREETSKEGIISSLLDLAKKSWDENLEECFVSYSGHGGQVYDYDHKEKDNKDECLIPWDYQKNGVITDDILNEIFTQFNPSTKIIFLSDSCHSGTITDTQYSYFMDDEKITARENKDVKPIPGRFICISGCHDKQTSADAYNVSGHRLFTGALTSCLLHVLTRKGLSISMEHLLKEMHQMMKRKGFTQIPVISSSHVLDETKSLFSP